MLTRPIDLANLDVQRDEDSRQDKQRKTTYTSAKKKRHISESIHERALQALQKLLAEQKKDMMGAAGPFAKMSLPQIAEQQRAPIQLEPSAQVMQLYDKLIDKLTHITKEGVKQTIFYLSSAAFEASVLRGAKITLTEYSTAPKLFNLSFSGDDRAVALFATHASDLQNALNNGGHRFGINRIDTALLAEDEQHSLKKVARDEEEEDA